MSLKTELALDRRKIEELHEGAECPKCESEEVEDFFREEIVPFFYQVRFNKAYRDANQIRLEISFRDPRLYRIMPTPVWTANPQKTQQYQNRIPFVQEHYTDSLTTRNKDEFWSQVSALANGEEWEIGGEIDLKEKELILTLDLT